MRIRNEHTIYYIICIEHHINNLINNEFKTNEEGQGADRMKLIVNEKDGCCVSIHIEYTPTEALIINQAMRRYVCDEEVNEDNKKAMEQMLEVEPIFREIVEESEDKDKCKKCEYYRNPDYTRCHECKAESEEQTE